MLLMLPSTLKLNKHQQPLPRLGLQVSSETNTLSGLELERLKKLRLDHLRVDLTPAEQDFTNKLRAATKQANALSIKLHIGFRLGENSAAELKRLGEAAE